MYIIIIIKFFIIQEKILPTYFYYTKSKINCLTSYIKENKLRNIILSDIIN